MARPNILICGQVLPTSSENDERDHGPILLSCVINQEEDAPT